MVEGACQRDLRNPTMRDTRDVFAKQCDALRIRGRRSWFLAQPYSRGDTYLMCALVESFRQCHGHIADDIVVVVKDSHRPIAEFFRKHISRIVTVPDAEMSRMAETLRNTHGPSTLRPDEMLFVHPQHLGDGRLDAATQFPDYSQKNMYQHLLGIPYSAPLSTPEVAAELKAKAQAFAQAHGIKPGRSVLIMPDANSYPSVEDAFWHKLSTGLAEAGWSVFTNMSGSNNAPRTRALDGSRGIDPPFEILLPLAEQMGWVVATLTGGMNIIITAQVPCRKTVVAKGPRQGTTFAFNDLIELRSAFPYAYQKTYDGEVYNIEELEVTGPDDYDACVSQILGGINNQHGAPPPAAPMVQMRAETTPGDVLDRITILQIKQRYLDTREARHNVQRELLALQSEISFRGHALSAELQSATQALYEANHEGWMTNEIIFKDFADDFGREGWTLGPEASEQKRAERMIQSFRKSQALNRRRVEIKREINELLNCHVNEEKSYDDGKAIPAANDLPVRSASADVSQAPSPFPGAATAVPPLATAPAGAPSTDAELAHEALLSLQFWAPPDQRESIARNLAHAVNKKIPRRDYPQSDARALEELCVQGHTSLGQIFSASQAARLVEYFRERPCYAAHVASYSDNIGRSVEDTVGRSAYASYKMNDVLEAPDLLDMALDARWLGLADSYLGCTPTLYSAHTFWTFAGHPEPGLTHGFHRDQDDYRFLSLFVYLTDVDGSEGPIHYLDGTHRVDMVRAYLSEYEPSASKSERYSPPDPLAFFPPRAGNGYADCNDIPVPYDEAFGDSESILTGAAGSGFLADTFGLHRGQTPTSKHRLVCWLRYGLFRHKCYEIDETKPHKIPGLGYSDPYERYITRLILQA